MSIVFVIDSENKPCLPTHPVRARKLLKTGRAIVKQVVPFTIKLNRKIDNPVGSFEVGIDDGAKHVGIAIKNMKTQEIIFHGQINHRQDVSNKVENRRNYRRTRRQRLRHRQPRFSNRIKSKIAPSIRQRKEVILRVINDFIKRLKLTNVKVEEVFFNHVKYNYGKYFSLVEIGKKYLREQIKNLGLIYETTFGYITKETRLKLGLNKRHSYDACAILESNKLNGVEYFIKPLCTKICKNELNNVSKKCIEKNGFRHYDLVKSICNKKVVIGSIRSLKDKQISLLTKEKDNYAVIYKKTRLLQRVTGLIYYW